MNMYHETRNTVMVPHDYATVSKGDSWDSRFCEICEIV